MILTKYTGLPQLKDFIIFRENSRPFPEGKIRFSQKAFLRENHLFLIFHPTHCFKAAPFYFSDMEQNYCLNCNEPITKKFCANCGQKAATTRITFGHFLAHDLLHGTFHLDRGILFTLREALLRPGKAALDYIGGKRIRYYNVFYLSLILIGLAIVVTHTGENVTAKGSTEESKEFIEFLSNNIKFILLSFVPLLAINARLLFWKMKLNLAEHFIAAGFTFVGVLVMTNILLLFDNVVETTAGGLVVEWILFILLILTFLFPAFAYGNLARQKHSFLGLLWRIVVFYIFVLVQSFLAMAFLLWLVTGKSELQIG